MRSPDPRRPSFDYVLLLVAFGAWLPTFPLYYPYLGMYPGTVNVVAGLNWTDTPGCYLRLIPYQPQYFGLAY